tara:strand:+ start:170 stop:391 length:222 start_codon:yes stop_codon:yes gene_type:complete
LETKDIIKLINELMEERKNVLKEVEELQKNCPHKEGVDIKFLPTTNSVRRICKTCQAAIGYPSIQELKDNGFT